MINVLLIHPFQLIYGTLAYFMDILDIFPQKFKRMLFSHVYQSSQRFHATFAHKYLKTILIFVLQKNSKK